MTDGVRNRRYRDSTEFSVLDGSGNLIDMIAHLLENQTAIMNRITEMAPMEMRQRVAKNQELLAIIRGDVSG